MIPVLFDASETSFTTYGKGKLADVISCVIHETLSGEYELEMKYPVTGPLFSDLVEGGVILADNRAYSRSVNDRLSGNPKTQQLFDIYKIGEEIDGVVTVYARHVAYRIARSGLLMPMSDQVDDFSGWVEWAFENASPPITDFSLSSLIRNYHPNAVYHIDPTLSYAGSTHFLDNPPIATTPLALMLGNGMLRDACEVGLIFSQFTVFAYDRKGGDYGASIHYGRNMTDYSREIDSTGTFNAVVPYWEKDGVRVTVTGGYVQPTTPITPIVAAPLDLTGSFETEPTEARLINAAIAYLDENEPWVNLDTIDVDMAIERIENVVKIELGDTVRVVFDAFGIDVNMRVVEYWYDVLSEAYQKLRIGTQQTEFVTVTGDTVSSSGSSSGGSPAPTGNMTALWTNSDTTSSFSAQDVTLSESIEDFDFILVGYVFSTSNQNYSSMMVPASTLWPGGRSCDLRVNSGSYNRTGARTFYASDATTVHFNAASYNTNTANGYVIPEHIIGVKL